MHSFVGRWSWGRQIKLGLACWKESPLWFFLNLRDYETVKWWMEKVKCYPKACLYCGYQQCRLGQRFRNTISKLLLTEILNLQNVCLELRRHISVFSRRETPPTADTTHALSALFWAMMVPCTEPSLLLPSLLLPSHLLWGQPHTLIEYLTVLKR